MSRHKSINRNIHPDQPAIRNRIFDKMFRNANKKASGVSAGKNLHAPSDNVTDAMACLVINIATD